MSTVHRETKLKKSQLCQAYPILQISKIQMAVRQIQNKTNKTTTES